MLKIILFLLFLPIVAMAQTAPPPPNDLQLMQARAMSAESRAEYLALLIQRLQAEGAKTAQWWADYIGAKPEPATPPATPPK